MIVVESRRKKAADLSAQYPGAILIDVTSHAKDGFVRFSPLYPHGGIPVPYSPHVTSLCVEGIWQGLKVFENAGVDKSLFRNDTMKGLGRTTRRFGNLLGYRKGVFGSELLDCVTARRLIYAPSYLWVLQRRVESLVGRIRTMADGSTVVLLDNETNCDIEDVSLPLSHAALIKDYIEGNYPIPVDLPPSPDDDIVYEPGQLVYHLTFGDGTVVEDLGTRVRVRFGSDVALLEKRYAKLLTTTVVKE